MSQRTRFVEWCLHQLGKPVLWNHNGPDLFDCSGLVVCGLRQVSVLSEKDDLNCEMMAKKWKWTSHPEPGDLVMYGQRNNKPEHVTVYLASGGCISASGASSTILTLEEAEKAKAMVRRYKSFRYRDDFLGFVVPPFVDEDDEPHVA